MSRPLAFHGVIRGCHGFMCCCGWEAVARASTNSQAPQVGAYHQLVFCSDVNLLYMSFGQIDGACTNEGRLSHAASCSFARMRLWEWYGF